MAQEKGVGNTSVLILKLLEEKDMYGYEMIETLAARSDDTFRLKAGTLYPILHGLEKEGFVTSYEKAAEGRTRKYRFGIRAWPLKWQQKLLPEPAPVVSLLLLVYQ